jgi:hypothetical protein
VLSAAGDSVVIALDSADVAALRDSTGFGFTVGAAQAGARVQIRTIPTLRTGVRPSNAVRDTIVQTTIPVETQPNTFVFTPEPPQPAGMLAAGGIRSARSLFHFELPDSVTGCAAGGGSCQRVALRDVQLNRVSLLLRRSPVAAAFAPLDSAIVSIYTITEPELGRRAPLGQPVLDPNDRVRFTNQAGFLSPQSAAAFAPADSLVELNITAFATSAARGDTVPKDFALLGGPLVGIPSVRPNARSTTPLASWPSFRSRGFASSTHCRPGASCHEPRLSPRGPRGPGLRRPSRRRPGAVGALLPRLGYPLEPVDARARGWAAWRWGFPRPPSRW